ncbi:MAG TPA: FkbM family methyltransferase [Thermoanaerobaculia bacterium]|nr:FkbM family methyltransferase [Thermoanaerobaculia bacterium]
MGALDPIRRIVPRAWKDALKRRLGRPLTRLQPDWKILEAIGPVDRAHVVFDVGAHEGWFLHSWKDWCPRAEIHAFEPAVEAYEKSVELYGSDPSLHFNNAGVGRARGTLELNVLEGSRVSNSFLKPVDATWREIDYHTGPITRRVVEVITLDDYTREHAIESIYLIKIDVQGFELEVLEGAKETLRRTDYVFVEAAIRPLYEGAPRFTHVHDFLDAHGFHLIAMRAWHRGNLTLVETDMLFRRNELMPPVDPNVERVTTHI